MIHGNLFGSCPSGPPPSNNHCFDKTSGFAVAPLAVDAAACEWQLIGSALVLTQNLNRFVGRWFTIAVKFRESLDTCRHRQIPFAKNGPVCSVVPPTGAMHKGKLRRVRVSILRRAMRAGFNNLNPVAMTALVFAHPAAT